MASIYLLKNREGQPIGWRAQVRVAGFPAESSPPDIQGDRDAVERWAAETERQLRAKKSSPGKRTLGDAIDDYLKDVVPHHKGGDTEEARLQRFKREDAALCKFRLELLPVGQINEYVRRRLTGEGYKQAIVPGSVKREINLLSRVFKHADPTKSLANPFDLAKLPPVSDARDEARITPEDEAKLLAALGPALDDVIAAAAPGQEREKLARERTRNPYAKAFLIVAIESATCLDRRAGSRSPGTGSPIREGCGLLHRRHLSRVGERRPCRPPRTVANDLRSTARRSCDRRENGPDQPSTARGG